MENPRQFASLDASEAGLHGSLTNRPASAVAAGDPIDFEAISARVRYERTLPTYQYKESPAEMALRLERQASAEERIRAETAETNERNRLLLEREQAQRNELRNRIGSGEPVDTEVSQPRRESPLSQMQRSTPERQPLPATGSPPPTPGNTSARADSLVEPTATPRPAAIREAIGNTIGGIGQSLPKSLPQAAGRLVIPGVGAGLTFAGALIAGQSVQQAATTTAVVTASSVAGGLIGTAVAGPIGGYVGSMIGGFAGGYLANAFFPPQMPSTAAKQEVSIPNYPPLNQAQTVGVAYRVSFAWDQYFQGNFAGTQYFDGIVWGPIEAIALGVPPGKDSVGGYVVARDRNGNVEVQSVSLGYVPASEAKNMQFLSISRVDGRADITPGVYNPLPPMPNTPYYLEPSPLNQDNAIPSGTPAAGKNKGVNRDVAPSLPSNNTPRGNGFFPGHGGLSPSSTPNPTQTPSNGGGMLPQQAPKPQPLPFAEPEDIPVPRGNTDGGVSLQSPLYNPPIRQNETVEPNPVTDALSPVPKAQAQPIPKTPEQAATDKTAELIKQQKKDFDDQIGRLTAIATAIAALTPAIQGLPDAIAKSPAVKAANKDVVQGAVCEIAQPTGCLGAPIKKAEDAAKANGDKLDTLGDKINALGAAGQAVDLGLLTIINNKLGDQVPGGISGFLKTFYDGFNKLTEWLHLDRALNLLTFIMTVQNVYFLCDSLKVVTLQMISDTLAVFGIKDKDNNPLNLNEILGHEVESLLKSILGEQELEGIKKEWKAFNRIYQAATNMLFAIQNMVFSVLQALEIIGSWNASIGNALKKYLVVGQNAFNWMNPNPNFHNNFFKFLGNALNVVTSLDFVAQSILQGRQAIDDFGKQTDELTKNIGEAADGFKPPEHKATAEAAKTSTNASKSPTPSPEEVRSVQDL